MHYESYRQFDLAVDNFQNIPSYSPRSLWQPDKNNRTQTIANCRMYELLPSFKFAKLESRSNLNKSTVQTQTILTAEQYTEIQNDFQRNGVDVENDMVVYEEEKSESYSLPGEYYCDDHEECDCNSLQRLLKRQVYKSSIPLQTLIKRKKKYSSAPKVS